MSRKASASARTLSIAAHFITSIIILAACSPTAVASVSLRSVVTYDAGAPCLMSIAVADVNADGKPDVLMAGGCTPGSVSVLLGNGDGTFQPAVIYDSGGLNTTSLQVADVNGDGNPDVLAASMCSTAACPIPVVAVLLGNGDGTFRPAVTYDSGLQALSLAVGDLNGDGNPDLVVGGIYLHGHPFGLIGVLLGNGDGSFQPVATYGSDVARAVALSDVNGDGKLDALATIMCSDMYCSSGLLGVLVGNGDGTFQSPVTYDAGYEPGSLAVADVNGDGKADALVAKPSTPFTNEVHSSVGVLLGKGDGTFGPVMSYDSGAVAAMSLAVADVDLDGRPDVVVAHCTRGTSTGYGCPGGTGIVAVLLGNGDGTFQPAVTFSSGGGKADSIAIADVSGDGRVDVLVANAIAEIGKGVGEGNGNVGVFVNSTKFATSTTLASSLNPSIYGQNVTWTAMVKTWGSVAPTGKVSFTWRIYSIGTAKLNSSGVATLTRSNLNADPYPLTAVYSGDANNAPSTSVVVDQVVTQTTTSATLTSSPNPSSSGQAVTFTATITSPTVTPTGPVTFKAGTTVLGTAQLSGGKAKFTISTLGLGSTKITATYYGNSNIAKSSASVTQTVH